jgi:uncharacterized membrane protein YeaQ/YmgE (transglycosylase-associated protein family)
VDVAVALVSLAVVGMAVGAVGRLAVPGPDPMPWWLTLAFGLAGAIVGGGIGYGLAGLVGSFVGAVIVAELLIIAYRRLVQGRGITGPAARTRPTRGFGLRRRP